MYSQSVEIYRSISTLMYSWQKELNVSNRRRKGKRLISTSMMIVGLGRSLCIARMAWRHVIPDLLAVGLTCAIVGKWRCLPKTPSTSTAWTPSGPDRKMDTHGWTFKDDIGTRPLPLSLRRLSPSLPIEEKRSLYECVAGTPPADCAFACFVRSVAASPPSESLELRASLTSLVVWKA